jgi:hypothetical protein
MAIGGTDQTVGSVALAVGPEVVIAKGPARGQAGEAGPDKEIAMRTRNKRTTWPCLFLTVLMSVFGAAVAGAQADAQAPKPAAQERDGSHDFDALLGSWKYHLRRRLNPLTGSNTWIDLEGTGVCRRIFDGAQIDQIVVDGAGTHIEGLTLRTYNPQTHLWSLHWANRRDGKLDVPQIGRFKDGHGEFFAMDMINGKSVLVKFDWTGLNTSSPHFEQSFSDDGGKTWEVNWITDQVRVKE